MVSEPGKFGIKLFSNHTFWYYALMCFFGALYYATAIGNHYYFRTPTFDYGTYNFALWQYSHLHVASCPMYISFSDMKGMSFFQDHFSLTLFYFIPVYWLINWLTGTYTILLIEITLILIGGWAIYKLVIVKTSDKWLGVLSLLYYFLLEGHFSTFSSDCNILVIVSCCIPLFLYFFETNRLTAAGIVLILSLLSREDMPLLFIFICIVLIIWHRKERKKVLVNIYYIAACLIYFILVFAVLIPLTHTKGLPYRLFNYTALGDTPVQAVIHILKHPIDTFLLLFKNQTGISVYNHVKEEFYWVYLISGGFILLFRPYYIIWFIPVIAQKMLNDSPIRWSIEDYYAITVVTLLPVSAFLILGEIKTSPDVRRVAGIVLCVLAGGVTAHYMKSTTRHEIPWTSRTKEDIFNSEFFSPGYDAKTIHSLLRLIPADAKVCASEHIVPQLSQREYIYGFPDVEDAQYIAAFTFRDYYPLSDSAYAAELNEYIFNPGWDVIAQCGKFVLLKKQPNQYKYITHFTCDAEKTTVRGDSLLNSDNVPMQMGDSLNTDTVHGGKYSVRLSSAHPYGLTYHFKHVNAGDIIELSAWRYSNDGNGLIALSLANNKVQYSAKNQGKGWARLTLSTTVPGNCDTAFFYLWDEGKTPVYFDDLQVYKLNK